MSDKLNKANDYIQRNVDFIKHSQVDETQQKKKCQQCHQGLNKIFFSSKNWNKTRGNRFCQICKYLHQLNMKIKRDLKIISPTKFEFVLGTLVTISDRNHCIRQTNYPVLQNSGQFRNVYAAQVTKGSLETFIKFGSHIVIKCFKDKQFLEGQRHTDVDQEMQEKAIEISTSFQNQINTKRTENIWIYQRKSHLYFFNKNIKDEKDNIIFYKNDPVMIESMIHNNYDKFNSNTGYTKDDKIMEALSHYSYHKYNMILCDLQGHQGKHVKRFPLGRTGDQYYLLTDPCILTQDRKQGLSDLGEKGISNFFGYHKCNSQCIDFKKPENTTIYYQKQESTSFEKPITGKNNVAKRDEIQLDKIIEDQEEEDDDEDSDVDLLSDD